MRPIQLLALVAAGFCLAVIGIWYFAYKLAPEVPAEVRVEGLLAETRVESLEDDVIRIRSSSSMDLYRALGFAQGAYRTWPALLLRQAAIGRLAFWFGDEAVDIDGHVAALRLDAIAREAFDALPTEDRSRLVAFANGMNAALDLESVRRADPLVVLRAEPARWEPWHTLAIEGLFAWLTLRVENDLQVAELEQFLSQRTRLVNSLYLSGFDRSTAWAFRRDDVTYLYYRLVHGNSALPFFVDVDLQSGAADPVAGLAIAGTPFLIAGKTSQNVWALLPLSTATVSPNDVPAKWSSARISVSTTVPGSVLSGEWTRRTIDEQMVSFRVNDRGSLVFADNDSTAVRLRWSGFEANTDAEAYHALLSNDNPFFRLQDGLLLSVSRSGLFTTESPEGWQHRFAGGVLVERSPWTTYHVERLNTLIRRGDSLSTDRWPTDTFSPWAEEIVPGLLETLPSEPLGPDRVSAALTYLRNWDYRFEPASIAGSIIDAWAWAYTQRTGVFPTAAAIAADTTFEVTAASALRSAVQDLERRFGADLGTWRWERAQEAVRQKPFWTYFDDSRQWFADTRYAPERPLGVGHPSTLSWGATSEAAGDPPAAWDIRLRSDRWESWAVIRNHPAQAAQEQFYTGANNFSTSTAQIPSSAVARRSTVLIPASN